MFLLPITPEMTLLWWIRNVVMAIAVILTTLTGFDYISKASGRAATGSSDKAARKSHYARYFGVRAPNVGESGPFRGLMGAIHRSWAWRDGRRRAGRAFGAGG